MLPALLHDVLAAIQAGRPVAWCRLVETRGSTPQKAGATMLVYEDGSQAGTLGGGCVEAEVKRRALAILAGGVPEIARFQLDSDYGWDDGLICGGRMLILIQPIGSPATPPADTHADSVVSYFTRYAHAVEAGQGITELVRFESATRQPTKDLGPVDQGLGDQGLVRASCGASLPSGDAIPAQWLVDESGNVVAALNGEPTPPQTAIDSLRPLATRPRPYAAGGMSYLPNLSRCRLIIVGGGHVGQAVGQLAAELDFDVWVVDDRAEYVSEPRFPKAQRRITGPFEDRKSTRLNSSH